MCCYSSYISFSQFLFFHWIQQSLEEMHSLSQVGLSMDEADSLCYMYDIMSIV